MQIQLGRSDDAAGVVRTEPTLVTRLTVVTMVEAGDWAVELPRPLFLQVGEQIWVEGASVFVRRPDGDVIRHHGSGFWLCR
jgi:hypothetical protein